MKTAINIMATALFAVASYKINVDMIDQPIVDAAIGAGLGYFGASIFVRT